MKFTSKNTTGNGTNRVSALKRLGNPTPVNSVHQRLSAPITTPVITDARQLLSNRNKPVFDARQLLSRQKSNPSLTIRNDMMQTEEEEEEDDDDQTPVFMTRLADGRLTSGNLNRLSNKKQTIRNPTEPISFTKTITNTSLNSKDDSDRRTQIPKIQSSSSDEKVVISFVNDQYRKRARSPSPPPIIRRLNNTSIQPAQHSSTLSRRNLDDHYEPPIKRNTSLRNTITDKEPKTSLKRTSTGAAVSAQPKPISSTQSNSDVTTVLITNLQSSVTEEDVIELFGEVGHINDIKTLSRGCVQIVYSKEEQAEQAVERFHNRLLDGQLMYVSRPQPTSYSTKSKSTTAKTTSSSSSSSNKITIDPSFIRQALFNPSDNTTNPVQFQVKL